MHQPDYVLAGEKTALMPWVRLHAVKGYADMISVAKRVKGVRAAFNFTPILVRQIQELAEKRVKDLWRTWAECPAADLDSVTKQQLLEHYFKAHWDHMIRCYPRYGELLKGRGEQWDSEAARHNTRAWGVHEWRDLQVWFNLAWCGYSVEARYPVISKLKAKGRHFSEADKRAVLDVHDAVLRDVLGWYRDAEEEGWIETTTTPYCHPILPLVYDTDLAHRCMPGRELPQRFQAPADVISQIHRAAEQHQKVFGRRPRGLWPSEGSVAPELIPILRAEGFDYFFSDEGVLFAGLAQDPAWQQPVDHLELFQGWCCEHEGVSVHALFRERPLSDFIGFNAARNPPDESARTLIGHLEHIASVARGPEAVCPLILDGENAWEAFSDGGEAFLLALYEGIAKSHVLRMTTPAEFFARADSHARLATLHTGSWIYSNFDIWIGDAEENRAWDLLRATREFLVQHEAALAPEIRAAAWEAIHSAEGSDWFWWYGPDFQTDNDLMFDALFRGHLVRVYDLCGTKAPEALAVPVCHAPPKLAWTSPQARIAPVMDGSAASLETWAHAGRYDPRCQATAMFQADRTLAGMLFGNDAETLYLRCDITAAKGLTLEIRFATAAGESPSCSIQVPLKKGTQTEAKLIQGKSRRTLAVRSVIQEVADIAIPLEAVGLAPEATAFIQLAVLKQDVEWERHPERELIHWALGEKRE
jgi:alpha-amylase/alpha-mannosidase (GH57 family)